jgi:hypothetical protein
MRDRRQYYSREYSVHGHKQNTNISGRYKINKSGKNKDNEHIPKIKLSK